MDKTGLTLGWLVGRQIAGQRKAQEKQPVAYRYGEIVSGTYAVAPALPSWDKNKYPYACIDNYGGLYVTTTPLIARQTSSNSFWSVHTESDTLRCEYIDSKKDRGKWGEWSAVDIGTNVSGLYWSNHDIYKTNNEIYNEAFEPVPLYLPLVLFDGECETKEGFSYGDPFPGYGFNLAAEFAVGDTLRITLDGKVHEYVAYEYGGYIAYAGNAFLRYSSNTGVKDDGGDVLLCMEGYSHWIRTAYIYTRTPGTYQLKIELISMEQ